MFIALNYKMKWPQILLTGINFILIFAAEQHILEGRILKFTTFSQNAS